MERIVVVAVVVVISDVDITLVVVCATVVLAVDHFVVVVVSIVDVFIVVVWSVVDSVVTESSNPNVDPVVDSDPYSVVDPDDVSVVGSNSISLVLSLVIDVNVDSVDSHVDDFHGADLVVNRHKSVDVVDSFFIVVDGIESYRIFFLVRRVFGQAVLSSESQVVVLFTGIVPSVVPNVVASSVLP